MKAEAEAFQAAYDSGDSSRVIDLFRRLSASNLHFLTRNILGFNKLNHSLHAEVCAFVQNMDEARKLILLPRGHYKTTCASLGFIIWLLIQDNVPIVNKPGRECRILLSKETASLAEDDLFSIETVLDNNTWIKAMWPDLIPEPTNRNRWNRQEMLVNRKSPWPEATVTACGVGGAKQGTHYDIIIFDDLIGKNAQDSLLIMDKTAEWFDYAESLFITPERSIANVIGTRWGRRDLYQHIIDTDTRYKVYTRQCIEDGQPIFPESFSKEFFDSLRVKNPAHYYSQYCNNPIDPGRCDFQAGWLKSYSFERGPDGSLYIRFEDDPHPLDIRNLDIVAAFDPSIDEKPTASRRAIAVTGMDSRQRVVLLELYSSRDDTAKVMDALFKLHGRWLPRIFSVESVAFSRLYVEIISKEAQERKRWVNVTPYKVGTRTSKDARIRDAIQQVAAEGRLYYRQSMADFHEEFVEFPASKTKDILDAVSMCIQTHRVPMTQDEYDEEIRYEELVSETRNRVTGY